MKDGIVLFTPGHGRGDALDGEAFPWIFPMGTNYQSESANLIEYIYKQEGKNLKGKKLAYVYLDTPFGREPLPVIQKLSKKLGFEIKQFGYSPPGNEQASVWTQVRRFRPDWVVLWGAGIGQAVAVKEAMRNGIPVDRITSCPHIYYPTVKLIGFDKAKGLTKVVNIAEGKDIPVIQAILKEVYGAGKGAGNQKYVGTMLYNSAVAASVFVPEAIRMAVKKYGKPVTAEKFRAACEQFKDFKAEGMMAPFTTSPKDHEGGGGARVVKFDGKKWVPVTEWFVSTFRPTVLEVAKESAAKFKAQGNPFKKPSIVVK
jgi:branched-chain amino acid transport system substrate-binding protein